MSKSFFQFKKFTIHQDLCEMKVGTDGVLLGAWAPIQPGDHVLDIGAGTGLVSLMLAQRGASKVVGVEIDHLASKQAIENVKLSPFSEFVQIVNENILHFKSLMKYDLVVSNPPYFQNSLQCENIRRNFARHADSGLTLDLLINQASTFVKPNGRFVVILPSDLEKLFLDTCMMYHFTLECQLKIFTRLGKASKRCIFAMKHTIKPIEPAYEELILTNDSDNKRTLAYEQLTSEFYL
jgi:tRNA1Val (adenine37-N6)-methyltransferase